MNIPGLEENAMWLTLYQKIQYVWSARIVLFQKKQETMGAAMKFAQTRFGSTDICQVASEAALDTPQSILTSDLWGIEAQRYSYNWTTHKIEGYQR
jgi:aspartate aminotransferase